MVILRVFVLLLFVDIVGVCNRCCVFGCLFLFVVVVWLCCCRSCCCLCTDAVEGACRLSLLVV